MASYGNKRISAERLKSLLQAFWVEVRKKVGFSIHWVKCLPDTMFILSSILMKKLRMNFLRQGKKLFSLVLSREAILPFCWADKTSFIAVVPLSFWHGLEPRQKDPPTRTALLDWISPLWYWGPKVGKHFDTWATAATPKAHSETSRSQRQRSTSKKCVLLSTPGTFLRIGKAHFFDTKSLFSTLKQLGNGGSRPIYRVLILISMLVFNLFPREKEQGWRDGEKERERELSSQRRDGYRRGSLEFDFDWGSSEELPFIHKRIWSNWNFQ